jgi:hypothetical protein
MLRAEALTTVSRLAEDLELQSEDQTSRLEHYVHMATSWVHNYCLRTFYYEALRTDRLPGYGQPKLLVNKPPIRDLIEVRFEGIPVADSDYSLLDTRGGILLNRRGWRSTASRAGGYITEDPHPGSEAPLYEVDYSAGYVTPVQADLDVTLTRDLPEDIEQACLILATSMYLEAGRNFRVRRAHLLEAGTWYETEELKKSLHLLLAPYRLSVGV